LVENGTHVLFATQLGRYRDGETTLAEEAVKALRSGMLCLADREFLGWKPWNSARANGADLLWRAKQAPLLPCVQRLDDGSYLSYLYPSQNDRRKHTNGLLVRVIEYRLEGVAGSEPRYRLVTTILDPRQAPARELAALYHERWEIETTLDEFKTHLRGPRMVLRSKTPDLVRQEFYGFLLTHFAIRGLMHEAALMADEDPDRLSFVHAVRVIRRKVFSFVISPQRRTCRVAPSGASRNFGAASGEQPGATHSAWSQAYENQISTPSSCAVPDCQN
jgi:Transposase DDE domain